MALTIDDLPADGRAVLRLLLDQGRSYGEIATTLKMAPAAVRDRAHDALSALGPQDASLGRERRAQVADWLLGQQEDVEALATEELLRGSAGARSWARAVSAGVAELAGDRLPAIPEAADTAAATKDTDADGADAGGARSASAAALLDDDDDEAPAPRRTPASHGRGLDKPASRRGGMALLAALALLVTLGAGVLIGRATKGDETKTTTTTAAAATTVRGQTNLRPPSGAPAQKALGLVQFVDVKGADKGSTDKAIYAAADKLPAPAKDTGYGLWLTRDGGDPAWLGYFRTVASTTEGSSDVGVVAQSVIKVNPADFDDVLLTRESGETPKTPGKVYLSGAVALQNTKG